MVVLHRRGDTRSQRAILVVGAYRASAKRLNGRVEPLPHSPQPGVVPPLRRLHPNIQHHHLDVPAGDPPAERHSGTVVQSHRGTVTQSDVQHRHPDVPAGDPPAERLTLSG
eukprot:2673597-Pyramimonas_sp.AAC.1